VRMLGVSEDDLRRLVQSGELKACRVHGQHRFNREDLLEWATARRLTVSTEALSEDSLSLPRLDEALVDGGVHRGIRGSEKRAVLAAALATVPLPDSTDRSFLTQMLFAREELASTGIGEGIAIPHVRNPVILSMARPMVALCYLESPVEFGAIDGKPVHVMFLIFTPSVRGHLHLLSRLMFALRDPVFRAALDARADVQVLVDALVRMEDRSADAGAGKGAAS